MIILNHDEQNNIELLLDVENNVGYFYNIKKKISIFDITILYNNSPNKTYFTLFIIKKPFWHP